MGKIRSSLFRFAAMTAIVIGLLVDVPPALADGFIIPEPPPGPDPPPLEDTWLTIRYHRVTVTIRDQVAVTRVEQEFLNHHDWECQGTYIFPLPEGAAVSEFLMWVDDTPVEGRILEADEARAIYEDVVRRRRDPALLEYVGRDAVQVSIFPIPPGESRRVTLEYTQVLPVEDNMVRYVYPLNTEKFSARPLEDVSVRVEIDSDAPMHAVYSPTHQDRVYVERDGDHRAVIGYEERDVLPDQDFELVYTVSQEDVGLNLLSYRQPGEDGFFLLLAAPTVEVGSGRVISRDVFLVLDTSGSMEGEKLGQAQEALAYVLGHLNAEDRFNVIAFSTGIQMYARRLRPAGEADEAIAWVEGLEAIGGTDINRALLEAMAQADSERPTVVIFLTDGLPTEGVDDVDQILANVATSASGNVRLFPFGVGDDVNTLLLDALAEQQRGVSGYVRPDERIDEEVSAFYAKISTPVLADVELDFDAVLIEDTYPHPLPDLFAGTQLILVGRYREGGPVRITLSGRVGGDSQAFVYQGRLRDEGGDDYIPRLWATRKIGHLLTQIRLHGEQREWVDAVVALSVRYGIITPYTSFLIEEEDILRGDRQDEVVDQFMEEAPAAPAFGAPAADKAEAEGELRAADSGGGVVPEEAAQVVRLVGDRTFVLQDGVWTDTAFDPSRMDTHPVGFGSAGYFEMLAARPDWGPYLALGERVIFVAPGATGPIAYEVVEGEGNPLPILPTRSPGSERPTPGAGPSGGEPVPATPRPGQGRGASTRGMGGGACAGPAMGVGLAALALAALWPRMRP